MTTEEILNLLEQQVAPVKVSDDFCAKYKTYDNSGIIINCGVPVTGVLFSLDLSEAAVERAVWLGYNLIVTHHPAIYGGVSRFDLTNNSQARALAKCLKHDISVISMHLNFDAAERGVDFHLMQGLGGVQADAMHEVEGGAYGRAYDITPVALSQFVQNIRENFDTQRVVCHGATEKPIKRVASFCGAGCDDNAVAFAKEQKADAVVSSDLSHHRICELVESGIVAVELTHYAAESYGFGKIYQAIKSSVKVPSSLFTDERFI